MAHQRNPQSLIDAISAELNDPYWEKMNSETWQSAFKRGVRTGYDEGYADGCGARSYASGEGVAKILASIIAERHRQDELWSERSIAHGGFSDAEMLTVLVEEIGEIAQALQEPGSNLRTELIQSAAVIVAWMEAVDKRLL